MAVRVAIGVALFRGALSTDLGGKLVTGHPDHATHAEYGGSVMERDFLMYKALPVGEDELKSKGWHKHGTSCDQDLGFAWTEDASGATKDQPMKLYTTAGGQPAGVGIIILSYHGQEPLPGPQKKWATTSPIVGPVGDPLIVHVDVAFRNGSIVCSGETDDAAIGNRLIVNPKDSQNWKDLPLTDKDAQQLGWHRGSCFGGMGWHWFYDTSLHDGHLSWQADNLFPVVTMFDKGDINAIFFASTINQVSIPFVKSNEWEPKSLSNSEMCKNLCDKECTFGGLTSAGPWSTAHIYFKDHSQVTCEKELDCALTLPIQMSCCESSKSSVVV